MQNLGAALGIESVGNVSQKGCYTVVGSCSMASMDKRLFQRRLVFQARIGEVRKACEHGGLGRFC